MGDGNELPAWKVSASEANQFRRPGVAHLPLRRHCLTSLIDVRIARLQVLAFVIFVNRSTMTADTTFLFTSGKITTPSTLCSAVGLNNIFV